MGDEAKTKEQLLDEIWGLRQRLHKIEAVLAQSPSTRGAGKRSEDRLYRELPVQTLLESASDGIVLVEANGCIALVNARVEEMFGYDRDELLGQPVEILLPTQYHKIHVMHRVDYLAQPHPRPMGIGRDLVGRRKDGTEFPVEIGLSSIERGDCVLTMGFIADISERKQAEETLSQYAVELQARNEDLDAFAHTVAHDLKDIAGRISGFAQVLEEDYATLPEQDLRSYLHIIAQNSRRMGNVIDELLLLAGVRRAKALDIEPMEMAHIFEEAQSRLVDLIEEYRAEILVPQSWPVALGYGPWVVEVWVNYISNAIKYGGQPPRVEVGATEQADSAVRFWVRDNGTGLMPEQQAHLFTPFNRLDQAHIKGHGLGLSIVRRIVEKLGGQVGVESQIGQGSVFFFILPT